MAGTYLGSVEWGWRRDVGGNFSQVPVSMKSEGVPTVNLLSAESIWNTAKQFYGLLADADPTNVVDENRNFVPPPVEKGTPLHPTGSRRMGGNIYYEVRIADGTGRNGTGRSGFVISTDTRMGDYGRDTVKLAVPEMYTVSRSGGTVLDGENGSSNADPILPEGTRVQVLGPLAGVPGYVLVQVGAGGCTGRRGILRKSYLTREPLGTHDTADLPDLYAVDRYDGTPLEGASDKDPILLAQGTSVQVLAPFDDRPGYVRVQVLDGPFAGGTGLVRKSHLTLRLRLRPESDYRSRFLPPF